MPVMVNKGRNPNEEGNAFVDRGLNLIFRHADLRTQCGMPGSKASGIAARRMTATMKSNVARSASAPAQRHGNPIDKPSLGRVIGTIVTAFARRTPIIGVHLDLKGMNFKPSYIPQYLADLAGQGINTVLVEYEDVFPFRTIRVAADRATVWSPATLRRFLSEAKRNGIGVVPLQECLGHLEYALGWDRYRRLAEDYEYPSTIRVGDPKPVGFILGMLREVLDAHPDSKYVHLGMDEAHALKLAAKRLKKDILDVFLDHLRELLRVVEPTGKMPMIWTDMLEDHFRPDAFEEFKGRVVFVTWDYSPIRGLHKMARLAGFRVSREWLEEPENPDAPPIGPGTAFVEDHRPRIARMLAPYRHGPKFTPLFQADLWTKLGMPVLGASSLRVSSNLSVLPPYNQLFSNVRGWSRAVKRTRQLGQIGTSWARGTSWCPPNYCIDLQWPVVTEMARTMDAKPKPFWPGIAPRTVDRIIRTLGRCREDWRLEEKIADEMDRLAPRVKAHRYEWDGIALMARVLALQRRAEYNLAEVEFFHANHRPVDTEWQRRIREQKATLRDFAAMKRRVRAHFGKRYHGAAFEEWISHLFDLFVQRIKDCRKQCRRKLHLARRTYAR